MPLNLELKIKLDSFDSILEKLESINAIKDSILLQKDIYYKIPDGTGVDSLRNKRLVPLAMHFLIRNSPDVMCRWMGQLLYRHTL